MDRDAVSSEFVRYAGTLAPVVAFGGILLATLLDHSFSWRADALSHLGIRSGSDVVFNGALVIGGLLALIYAAGLWNVSADRGERSVSVLFGLAALHLAGVGTFPAGHRVHAPAAIGFYTFVTLVFALDRWHRRHTLSGRVSLGLGALQVLIWGSFLAGAWPVTGLALPEFASALLVPCWIWWARPAPTWHPSNQSIAM